MIKRYSDWIVDRVINNDQAPYFVIFGFSHFHCFYEGADHHIDFIQHFVYRDELWITLEARTELFKGFYILV